MPMHAILGNEMLSVSSEPDLIAVRNKARLHARAAGFGLTDETKLVTAVSELARNMISHGGGGQALIEDLEQNGRQGIRVTFTDRGPGIANIGQAMQDGYSSINGLGLGLPGARRLVHDFEIKSSAKEGTHIVIVRWNRC